jgi:hypothetical protein
MGINIFLLEKKPIPLLIGGVLCSVGSLRRYVKLTEFDDERAAEIEAAERAASAKPSPLAVMLADVSEIPLENERGAALRAHRVLGWDEGRTSVTDYRWDLLPTLGYAVREPHDGEFVLHEYRDGCLHQLSRERSVDLGLLDARLKLARHCQPSIVRCEGVKPFYEGVAEADCLLDNGYRERIFIKLSGSALPETAWFAGKRPRQVETFPT